MTPASLSLPAAVRADTLLLSLIDTAAANASESVTFLATDTTMTVSIGGYQIPAWEVVTNAAVTVSTGGSNLLGAKWTLAKAMQGSDTRAFADGVSVPGLLFGGLVAGDYDTYSQVVSTVVGDSYTLSFLYTNTSGSSGLLASYHADGPLPGGPGSGSGVGSGVPEPTTWALTLFGVAVLGYAGLRRRSRKITLADG